MFSVITHIAANPNILVCQSKENSKKSQSYCYMWVTPNPKDCVE